MGTNVFNHSGAMASSSVSSSGITLSRHHHSALDSSPSPSSTMLYTAGTPVAGTPLSLTSSPTTTAFPFPPSPLFLPALTFLQQSAGGSHHPHLPSHLSHTLSPWLSGSPLSASSFSPFGMATANGAKGGAFTPEGGSEFTSDDNNNDLHTTNAQQQSCGLSRSPPKGPAYHRAPVGEPDTPRSEAVSISRPVASKPPPADLKAYVNGLFETPEKESLSMDQKPGPKGASPAKPQAIHGRSDNLNWALTDRNGSPNRGLLSPSMKTVSTHSKHDDLLSGKGPSESVSGPGPALSNYKPPFLMGPYVGGQASVSSPTFPLGIRPPPPSPHTPTHPQHPGGSPFGSHYPHYLLPPSLYSYYHNQQQHQQNQQSYSPTSQQSGTHSPGSPFLVPNLPQSASPSLISSMAASGACAMAMPGTPTSEGFSIQTTQHHQQHHQHHHPGRPSSKEGPQAHEAPDTATEASHLSHRRSSSTIDLTHDRPRGEAESPVDCSKAGDALPSDSHPNGEPINGLKRKGRGEETAGPEGSFKSTVVPAGSGSVASSATVSEALSNASSAARKARLLKPPNISISEVDYRSPAPGGGHFSPAFLHSPLFGQHFATHGSPHHMPPTSPYTTYLEHSVPLSAPPIAPPHHSSSSSKFDFPGQTGDYPPSPFPLQRSSSISSSKEGLSHSLLRDPAAHYNSTSQLASNSTSSCRSTPKSDSLPSSIMKDTRKRSLNECKVTFQVPQSNHNAAFDGARCREKSSLAPSPTSLKRQLASLTGTRKGSCQKYPEYFRKGSAIKLGNGGLKKVEELSTEDFIESASAGGKFKVELSEVVSIHERSKKTGLVRISFLVGGARVRVSLDSPLEHPFFVYQKGWSSCSPSTTSKRYGLACNRLNKGDIVVTLAGKLQQTPNQTPSGKSLSSQQLPRSLASSSGSLSSASSASSTCSLTTTPSTGASVYASGHLSLPKAPPPAHHSQPSHKSLLGSNGAEAALNLDTKSPLRKLNLAYTRKECRPNQNRDEDDEEIVDVEKVDDEERAGQA